MIELHADIQGHRIRITGSAQEVVDELEVMRQHLGQKTTPDDKVETKKAPAKKSKPKKTTEPVEEEQTARDLAPEKPEAGDDGDPAITIADLRKAIQGASRDNKKAAKQYLIDTTSKADLNALAEDNYAELMALVSDE